MAGHERSQRARVEAIDGSALRTAFASGAAWLGENKGVVDSLNYSVPDGDTGTNMFNLILKEAQKSASSDIGVVADAISWGRWGQGQLRRNLLSAHAGVRQTPPRHGNSHRYRLRRRSRGSG